MMLNFITPCNKILYAIINTLLKITTTPSIYFEKKFTNLEFNIFKNRFKKYFEKYFKK